MKNLWPFLCFITCLLVLASCSSSRKLTRQLDGTFEKSATLENGFHGFMVYDPEQREVLYQHNADKYFTPASNTKLFTFYTSLKLLGDSIPGIRYHIQGDSLYFWGTGDPSFLHEDFPYSPVLEFLRRQKQHLVYIPANYQEKHFGPGWAWGDYNWYYSPERGAFPIYGNYVSVEFTPQDSFPQAYPQYFQKLLEPGDTYPGPGPGVMRDLKSNRFLYKTNSQRGARTQKVPFVYSEFLAIDLLRDTLAREITIKSEVPEFLNPTQTVYSVPADSLYKPMLQRSDNFYAEQLLLLSSEAISDSLKADIAIDYMKKHYLKDLPDEPQWRDGSGLSRYNLFTPRSMVKLLEKIQRELPQERLFQLLPAGGVSGTIKQWYRGEEPYVFAKTGTLNNNHSLSGYLKTKSGKVFIFSFMNSNYLSPTSDVKREMEKVLRAVHEQY